MQQELTKNVSKIDQKSTKWGAKTSQNRSLELSGRVLEGSGEHLGPKKHQDTNKRCEKWELSPPQTPPVGCQNLSKLAPRAIHNVIIFLITFWIDFWSDLVPTCLQLGSQNLPKMEPSWFQNRCKLWCWFEGCFWKDVGTIFIDSLPQHDMAEVATTIENTNVF